MNQAEYNYRACWQNIKQAGSTRASARQLTGGERNTNGTGLLGPGHNNCHNAANAKGDLLGSGKGLNGADHGAKYREGLKPGRLQPSTKDHEMSSGTHWKILIAICQQKPWPHQEARRRGKGLDDLEDRPDGIV
jgi:hypothetical protein